MSSRISPIGLLAALTLLSTGCTTSLHGSFAPSTFVDPGTEHHLPALGPAVGESCQTRVLYVFPVGPEISTHEATQAALAQHEGTRYLANVSIDDRISWGMLYSEQCIIASAVAH